MTGYQFQDQKVKGQGHQAALLSAALTRKAAAAVSVGTYSAWESTLHLLGGARAAWAPTVGREERGHIVSPRAQLVYDILMQNNQIPQPNMQTVFIACQHTDA